MRRQPIIEALTTLVLLGALSGCQSAPQGYRPSQSYEGQESEEHFSTIVTAGIPHVFDRFQIGRAHV